MTLPTRSSLSHACAIGALQFGSYFILTLNMRAVASLDYLTTAVTDVFVAGITFSAIKRVASATTHLERMSYIAGGVLGAQAALLWSEYGHAVLRLWFLATVSK
jgi:hypothetical protein